MFDWNEVYVGTRTSISILYWECQIRIYFYFWSLPEFIIIGTYIFCRNWRIGWTKSVNNSELWDSLKDSLSLAIRQPDSLTDPVVEYPDWLVYLLNFKGYTDIPDVIRNNSALPYFSTNDISSTAVRQTDPLTDYIAGSRDWPGLFVINLREYAGCNPWTVRLAVLSDW